MKDIIQNLKLLLQTDSKSSNIESVNLMAQKVYELFSDLDLEWTKHSNPNAGNFYVAKTKIQDESSQKILISTHIDCVYEPYEVQEKEGKLYGSGSSDMKASIIVAYSALKKLKEENKLKNITIYFNPEEELAVPHYRKELRTQAQIADYAFVMESTMNNVKSENILDRSVVVSRRGFKHWDLFAKGPGGHSGVLLKKEERHSLSLLLSEFILKLETLADYEKRTTINTGVVQIGHTFNIIASEGKLSFECRFSNNSEADRITNEVQKMVDEINSKNIFTLQLDEGIFIPAMFEDPKCKDFVELCKSTAKEMNLNFFEERRGGGSEASILQFENPKLKVLDGFGVKGDGEHTQNEFVYVESIFSSAEYLYRVLSKIVKK